MGLELSKTCPTMTQKTRSRISLAERTLPGRQIIAQQSEISYAEALARVQRLKKTSTVTSSLKKSRPKFFDDL